METLSSDGQPMGPGLSERHRTFQQEWALQPDAPRPQSFLVWPRSQPSRVRVRLKG